MKLLEDIRVLDLTRLLPGPFGTTVLADLGAEVIKLESPLEPDWSRGLPGFYSSINRGKKSLSVNLKKEEGKEIFFKLVSKVDALTEQFRPGVMDKLGIGFEQCKEHNPNLVYVSLSGYGSTGPYAKKAGHDLNYLALAGIAGISGTADGRLSISGVQVADQVSGLYLVIAILAGLNQSRTKKQAVKMEVSIFESALALAGPHVSEFFRTGFDPGPAQLQLNGALANYQLYQTKDGRWISLCPLEGKFWSSFCKAAGRPDWELRLLGGAEEHQKLKVELGELFRTRTLKEWEQMLGANPELCVEPVRKFSELESDPQVKARGLLCEVKDRKGNKLRTVPCPVRFPDEPQPEIGPAPDQGESTEQILLELGYNRNDIEEFRKKGAI
jgi:alpha-methylacyl-CoA racemase